MKRILATLAVVTLFAGSAHALPALQLGPGGLGTWTYDNTTQTWVTADNPFSVNAYANSNTAGASGQYAWDPAGAGSQKAYLVVSAIPMINFDGIDVSVVGDGGALALVSSGFGAPPVSDPNDLAPHSIFDTWFEVYCFEFNGAIETIPDTQTGGGGSDGYREEITITINSLAAGVNGVHMDLFTMVGDGDINNNADVKRFAPFSHDAENIPEPGSLLLLSLGIVGAGIARRRRK